MDTTITINWGVLLTLSGIIVAILVALGLIKPLSTAKERMKKKILKNLNKLTNKECILLPEIRLRDEVYWDHLGHKPLLKKRFFSLFIESISELSDSRKIICEDRKELFYPYPLPFPPYKKEKDPFPPYDSRINITPSDYFLGEDKQY